MYYQEGGIACVSVDSKAITLFLLFLIKKYKKFVQISTVHACLNVAVVSILMELFTSKSQP